MKPNNTRLWLAALLSLSISGTSLALPTDRNQPIHVSADTATMSATCSRTSVNAWTTSASSAR
jgi:hypothetical protein